MRTALLFEKYMPGLMDMYFLVGIVLAFAVTFVFGYRTGARAHPLSVQAAARHDARDLGREPDPAAGVSPLFGPKEVGVPTVSWLQGAWAPTACPAHLFR